LSRRTLEKQYVQHSYRKKRYFTNKNRKIGFKKIDQELPIWISEALKELEH
ncbi:RNA-binding protein, partial [Enterococcus cecorum]|nr:RNA-binding protein [Enterococcus cecorum]